MILSLPAVLFAVSLLVAYGSAGRRRQVATVGAVLAATWSLALLVDPSMVAWAIGPILATLLLPRRGARARSSFEGLTRRVITFVPALLAALFLASRLPVGENPVLLSAVPWFLGAFGVAWFVSPIDQVERLQGQVLMVAAAAAILLAAAPAGGLTAGLAGALAVMPVAGERWRLPGRFRPALSALLLLLAAAAALLAAAGPPSIALVLFDVALNVSSTVALGMAILLVAGAAATPIGIEWAAGLGVLALAAGAPGLRWAALAGLVAVATTLERRGERPAWIATGVLALTTVFQSLAAPSWSARAQLVAFACGFVLMLFAARAGTLRVLVLPTTALLVMLALGSVNAGNLVRFQWIAAVGALLLVMRTALTWLIPDRGGRELLRDRLIAALLLVAISARDALGLGGLAVVLLLIDAAIVRIDVIPLPSTRWSGLLALARSNWPGSITFAAAAIAVIAALQVGLALGLLAATLLAALQLAPLKDRRAGTTAPERPRSALQWVGPALSIGGGIAPALLLRMLH
ncbi:MAG TPA: hypothetical protein VGR77_02315 [Candidatus Dormibacteraeota bacterium]|nr:hypothetical protein [Candidatus Dormibacteraeota bacterium]